MKKLIYIFIVIAIIFISSCEKHTTELVWCDYGRWGEAEWIELELHQLQPCSENNGYACTWLDQNNNDTIK